MPREGGAGSPWRSARPRRRRRRLMAWALTSKRSARRRASAPSSSTAWRTRSSGMSSSAANWSASRSKPRRRPVGRAAALGHGALRVQQEVADLVGDREPQAALAGPAAQLDGVTVAHGHERRLGAERLATPLDQREVEVAHDVAQRDGRVRGARGLEHALRLATNGFGRVSHRANLGMMGGSLESTDRSAKVPPSPSHGTSAGKRGNDRVTVAVAAGNDADGEVSGRLLSRCYTQRWAMGRRPRQPIRARPRARRALRATVVAATLLAALAVAAARPPPAPSDAGSQAAVVIVSSGSSAQSYGAVAVAAAGDRQHDHGHGRLAARGRGPGGLRRRRARRSWPTARSPRRPRRPRAASTCSAASSPPPAST